jgi:hypothetical protein
VHGVETDDVFQATAAASPIAVVTRAGLFESEVRIEHTAAELRAFEAIAVKHTTRTPIAIVADDPQLGAAIAAAIHRAPRLCVGDPPRAAAGVRTSGGQLWLLDEHGPMCLPVVADAAGIAGAVVQLARLGAARTLQRTVGQLAGGEIAMMIERLASAPGPLVDGAMISATDRLCVRVTNHGRRTLWLHLFAIGPGPALRALGAVSSGIQVLPRASSVFGVVPCHGAVGFALPWPDGVLADRARPIELAVIATSEPVDLSSVMIPELGSPAAPAIHRSEAPRATAMKSPEPTRRITEPRPRDRAVAMRRCLWQLP